jgi:hypothetical protein
MPSDSENNFLVLTECTFKLQSHPNAYRGSSITVRVLPPFIVNSTSCPLQFNLLSTPHRTFLGQSEWPCGLRCGSTATHLLGLWVEIPPGTWMSVSCACCVLSDRSLCIGLITHPETSCQVWCVYLNANVKPE